MTGICARHVGNDGRGFVAVKLRDGNVQRTKECDDDFRFAIHEETDGGDERGSVAQARAASTGESERRLFRIEIEADGMGAEIAGELWRLGHW